MTLREAIDHPDLRRARTWLEGYKSRASSSQIDPSCEDLADLKRDAVSANDQLKAKAIWCLETMGEIQDTFVSVFRLINQGEFKEAWDLLERCEISIHALDRHFTERDGEFGIEHVRTHTRQLQELYPYKWGVSPGMVYTDIRCSVCDSKLTLRRQCDHEVGEIYDGEMCCRVIKEARILHVSLVDNPFQKYSVIFPDGDNDRRLFLVKSLADALTSPWDPWSYSKEERRRFHPRFKNLGRNDICACSSGLKYKKCCAGKEYVYPHFEFSLMKKPRVAPKEMFITRHPGQTQ